MRNLTWLSLSALVWACSQTPLDDIAPDAADDATLPKDATTDTGKPKDSSLDTTSSDAPNDASMSDADDAADADDASDADDAADADDSSIDSGTTDGGICPICSSSQACCTLVTSKNYGKCYAKACLSCCM